MKNLYSWGESVKVSDDAATPYAGRVGSICGIRTIESPAVAERFGQPQGGVLYLLEFQDGTSTEVPEKFLLRYD